MDRQAAQDRFIGRQPKAILPAFVQPGGLDRRRLQAVGIAGMTKQDTRRILRDVAPQSPATFIREQEDVFAADEWPRCIRQIERAIRYERRKMFSVKEVARDVGKTCILRGDVFYKAGCGWVTQIRHDDRRIGLDTFMTSASWPFARHRNGPGDENGPLAVRGNDELRSMIESDSAPLRIPPM